MTRIRPVDLSVPAVWHVVKNMRHSDWQEISNLIPRHLCTVDGITMAVMQTTSIGMVIEIDDVPAVVVQLSQKHDGCWSVGLFATDEWVRCWRATLKEIRHIIIPSLIEAEARYCEAHVMACNMPARALLERIGFRRKSEVLTNYGAFGKDFILYAINHKDLSDVFKQPERSRPHSPD